MAKPLFYVRIVSLNGKNTLTIRKGKASSGQDLTEGYESLAEAKAALKRIINMRRACTVAPRKKYTPKK